MKWELHPVGRFARDAERWDTLQRAVGAMPFHESAFLRPLLDEFGSGREVVAFCEDKEASCAATIMTPRGYGMWETFQPSQLPLGAWIASPATDIAATLAALLRRLPGFALLAGATQLDPRLQPRPENSSRLHTLDYVDTAWVDVAGDFEAYWQARGKNLRQNVRKQRTKLNADALDARLECLTAASDVAACIREYGELESSGWKASSGTAVHPDNAQGRFYRLMLENFCALGRGRIYRFCVAGRPVAMDLCIESGPVLIILKTTYDESFKAISPASLMHHDIFQSLFEERRFSRIEFYGKLMEWHTRWTDHARMLYHATCYRSKFLPAVRKSIAFLRHGASPHGETLPSESGARA
jgi:hypothetical protein